MIELECDSEVGLKFIAEQIKEGQVKGFAGCKSSSKSDGPLPMVELASYSAKAPS